MHWQLERNVSDMFLARVAAVLLHIFRQVISFRLLEKCQITPPHGPMQFERFVFSSRSTENSSLTTSFEHM